MKFHLLISVLLVSSSVSAEEWKLVWQDEFDGQSLDFSKWEIEVNAFGGGNNELQIFTDRKENVRVEEGKLILEARRDNQGIAGTVREYSSGRIRSKRRGDWTYGKFEIRAMLPAGQGLWPAIWMLPSDDIYGTWASSGEIDIMEFKGQDSETTWGTLHYGGAWPKNVHSGEKFKLKNGSLTKNYHTYAIEWELGEIRWYLDGNLWQTQNKWHSEQAEFPAPFDQQFHLIMNLSVGGKFVGPVATETQFPARMFVDYVRVYQK